MFVAGVPVTTHVDSPLVDLHNEKLYMRQQRGHRGARMGTHTHARGTPREYNDPRLFIPPLTSAAPRMPRELPRESSERQF